MKSLRKLLAGLALVAVATAAWALVTFDPNTGTGFAGKGDVCIALGISKCKNPGTVYFTYSSKTQYTQDCSKDGVRQTLIHTYQRMRNVTASVTGTVRDKNPGAGGGSSSPNEGWILSGFGSDLSNSGFDQDGNPLPPLVIPPSGSICPIDWIPLTGLIATTLPGSGLSVGFAPGSGVVIWQ